MADLDAAGSTDFESLLAQLASAPDLKPLLALDWAEFAHFVDYLFTCAGFWVEDVGNQHFPNGIGVDLNTYLDEAHSHLVARIEVRRYHPDHPLDVRDVRAFAGVLTGLRAGGIPGYLVTCGTFTGPSYFVEEDYAPGLITLIDGKHLLRYITYVHGSRVKQADGHERASPPVAPSWLRKADTVRRPDPQQTRVLVMANNRGGVAKTVTTLELGIGLASQGKRVLAVDLDGQASLTLALPTPQQRPAGAPRRRGRTQPIAESLPTVSPLPAAQSGDLSDFFARRCPLQELVRETAFEHLWLIPSGKPVNGGVVSELHRMDSGGAGRPEDELAFAQAIADLAETGSPDHSPYDWILLDTPPAQTRYTRAALAAAHEVLVCTGVEVFAAQGVNGLLDTADTMRALMGSGVRVAGAVITRWPRANRALQDERLKLEEKLARQGVQLLAEPIPLDDKVDLTNRNAVAGGFLGAVRGLFGYPASPATLAYNQLIDALLKGDTP